MQVLLRRASSLAKACNREAGAKIRNFEISRELRLSAHSVVSTSDVTERLETASRKAMQKLDEAVELYLAQARIRGLIGQANAKVVSPLLAERETYLKAAEKALNTYLGSSSIFSHEETECEHNVSDVTAKLTGIRQQLEKTSNTGSVADTIRVSRLSESDTATIRDRITAIQRRTIDLNEELAKANFDQFIVIPDEVVAILRKHKIIG